MPVDVDAFIGIRMGSAKGLTDFIYDILKVGDIKGTETFIVLPDPGP